MSSAEESAGLDAESRRQLRAVEPAGSNVLKVLVEERERLMAANERLQAERAGRLSADAALLTLRLQHTENWEYLPDGGHGPHFCEQCDVLWPCPSVLALDALTADLAAARAEVEGLKNTIEIQERGKYGRAWLTAENQRLREALERIRGFEEQDANPWKSPVEEIADAALRPAEPGAEEGRN